MPTLLVQNTDSAMVRGLVKQFNRLHEDTVADDGYIHSDQTGVVSSGSTWDDPESDLLASSAATAADLATVITMTNSVVGVFNVHCKDALAHRLADTTNPVDGYAQAADLATVEAQLNALHHRLNAHLSQAIGGVDLHLSSDAANVVASPPATDQSSAEVLANALQTEINAHVARGPGSGKIRLLGVDDQQVK